MDDRIISSSEAQATGAYVDMLNSIRAEKLLRANEIIAARKIGANKELEKLRIDIEQLIASRRGGKTGIHGFIGERIQVGFANERAILQGERPKYVLIDDNGMTDYLREKTPIQQKACISDKNLGLTHILSHSEKYPLFIENNGVYQIPRDFYEKYKKFLNMPESKALKLRKEDLRMWLRVREFHRAMPDAKVEPMISTYAEIQADTVGKTIQREEVVAEHKYKEQCASAEESCRASFQEGAKVVAWSAAFEGAVSGCISIIEHKKDRNILKFKKEDWKEVGIDTIKGIGKGAVRGAAVYATTNAINMPASVATAAVTGAFTIAEKTIEFARGKFNGKEYVTEIADGCVNMAVSVLFAELGRRLIPIPVLGPIIGNAIGMFVCKKIKKQMVRTISSTDKYIKKAA